MELIDTPLKMVVAWLDNHVFHIGYLPHQHAQEFSDTHFGIVLFLNIFIIALVSSSLWSLPDKKRPGYNRFYYWSAINRHIIFFLAR